MTTVSNPQLEQLLQLFETGLLDEAAVRTALARLGQSEAQIETLIAGTGNIAVPAVRNCRIAGGASRLGDYPGITLPYHRRPGLVLTVPFAASPPRNLTELELR
jgi:hypothetical protein